MAFNVISNITLDMKHAYSVSNIVQVNQYDTAGVIKAQLLNDGAKWLVPQDAKPVVMFKKTDNIGGFYDVTDMDPEIAAVSIDTDRSIIYISLDPQTTTTATSNGKYVDMQVAFFENGLRISTFAFYMQVLPSVITSGDLLPDKNKQFTSSWIFNILSKEIADTLTVATTPQAMTDWLEANITQETGYVIDNTLTVAGAASDAQATGKMVTVSNLNPNTVANKVWVKKTPATLEIPTMEDVDEVNRQLNAIANIYINDLKHVAYYENNAYYSGTTLRELPTGNVSAFAPIDITANTTYYFKSVRPYFCWIEYEGQAAARLRETDNPQTLKGSFTADSNGKVYITVPKNEYNLGLCLFTDSAELYEMALTNDVIKVKCDATLSEVGVPADAKATGDAIARSSSVKTKVILDVGQNQTYTSLRTALEYATENYSQTVIFEIRIHDETYDVINDLTQEELSTASSYVGLRVTKNVRVVGVNNYRKSTITLTLSSDLPAQVRSRISTLNLLDNAELENLTVYGERTRYAVHDDFFTETDRTKTIKNCKFVSNLTYYRRAYGAGLRSGDNWTFENCIFQNVDETYYAPFSCHNNLNFTAPAFVKFMNCRFIATQTFGVMFGSLNTDTDVINTVVFEGNSITGATTQVYAYEENAATYGSGSKFAFTGFGNTFNNSNITYQVTDGVDYSDYKQLI